jgi:integrase
MIILTACRTIEVRLAQWKEFNFDKKVWSIPPERMKARNLHEVPLSDRVIQLLQPQQQYSRSAGGSAYVFTGYDNQSPLSYVAPRNLLHKMIDKEKATVHGFRASFKTFVTEQTDHPWELVEMCLAHEVGTGVAWRYLRGTASRRPIMQAWADYCGAK